MNRECRCRKGINEKIEMEERKEHFMGLLDGMKNRIVKEERRGRKKEKKRSSCAEES